MSEGVKYDGGKLRWSLLPLKPIQKIIEVLMFGADKYPEADNWKRVPDASERYYDAMLRHLTVWYMGEKTDEETGLSHLAHAGCCLLFLMWFDCNKKDVPIDTENSVTLDDDVIRNTRCANCKQWVAVEKLQSWGDYANCCAKCIEEFKNDAKK